MPVHDFLTAHSPRIIRSVCRAQIKGMEDGLHSMRVGGTRRIIIPQGLGYTVQGLGPYPADPRKRDVLVQVNTAWPPFDALAAAHCSMTPLVLHHGPRAMGVWNVLTHYLRT